MNTANHTKTGNDAFELVGALDIYAAESVREVMLTRFKDTDEITLDLGKVETCDTAGIQLLLAARRKATEGARTLRFSNFSPAVRDCCQCLGLPENL